jgi:hypothetical protein
MSINTISGKIVQKESGLGIPDLLVVIYDLDPGTRPEEVITIAGSTGLGIAPAVATPVESPGDRLGSVLTDAQGAFELSFDDTEYQLRNPAEQRPDLLLLVMAPEEIGVEVRQSILFTSTTIRQNAGRTEQYLIRLTADQLTKAGIPLPTTPNDAVEEPNLIVNRLVATDLRKNTIIDGLRLVEKNQVDRVRQTAEAFHTDLKPRLRARLSRVPENLIGTASFVADGESVVEKATELMRSNIRQIINNPDPKVRPPINTFVALTAAQKETLKSSLDADGSITADELDKIIHSDDSTNGNANGAGRTTFLLREDPLTQFCREKTKSQQDLEAALGISGQNPSPGGGSPQPGGTTPTTEPITEQDILRFAGELMETMTSPEEKLLTDLEPRASRRLIEEDIQSLSFAPSPADVPAFYDFHNLQIAFEHVWQEVIDEGIINLSEDAFHQIVELGGNPTGGTIIVDPVLGLSHEIRTVMTAQRFVRDHRNGDSSAPIVRDHRKGDSPATAPPVVRDHRNLPVNGNIATFTEADPLTRLPALLEELERRLKEDYAFTIYAANRKERSINFAVLITYRQKWEPLGYQAGRLVKTITLAPRETIKYSKKTVTHRKRASKEVENHLRSRREETSSTTRSEQDIVRKATQSTNFSLTSQDTVEAPGGVGGSSTMTTTFQQAASKASDDTKKSFHEAVFKAAQEFKDENTTEVNTEESVDVEITESGEITNPNDELALTCLFYELQRRYRVTEQIHSITPVILVAQEVPRPDEIDEAWLITNDWILRRTLLDDSFLPALNYLCQNIAGDEIGLQEMRQNVLQQRSVVTDLRAEIGVVRDRLSAYRQLLERSLAHKASGGGGGGLFSAIPVVGDLADDVVDAVEGVAGKVGDLLYSGAPSGATAQDTLKDSLDRSADEERDLLFRLEREVTALNDITEKYAKALAEHFNHKSQIDRLRIHIKQNILYYMQAIWSHEPPDQRFFRLHKTPVPIMEAGKKHFRFPHLEAATHALAGIAYRHLSALDNLTATDIYPAEVITEIKPNLKFTTLVEVADLDTFLGYKGNYMMFPLRESNALTDYMMHPYIVAGLNELVDPDDLGNWTLEDFSKYVVCLKEQLSEDDFAKIKDQLIEQYKQILTNPRPNGDEITVPTNSLFIELMPSESSNIEEYKRKHRILDVKKVQAEVRKLELENIRYAARLLAGEHEDPDVERKIVVEGASDIIVPPDPA